MINIIINSNKIVISGHAGFDKYGKDIVCAAVSSTVLTTINAILLINKDCIKVTEGEILIIDIIKQDEVVNKLIINMISMLKEIEKDYSKYIKINEEV